MKVHYGLDKIPQIKSPVVTSGTFDGVHLGHQTIITRLKEIARDCNGETVVLTFWPHPRYVLGQKSKIDLKLLSSLEEKILLLNKHGVDHLIIIPFTKKFSQLSSKAFIENIIQQKINTQILVIGYDHKFGKNREGSFEYLKTHQNEFGFEIEEIPRRDVDDIAISSTKIRSHLESGNVANASIGLGSPYLITGKVVIGDQLGRKIGFPTANIKIAEEHKLVPADGVYAVKVMLKKREYLGMLNIGFRPTVNGVKRSIEVNIFDFSEDIYGEEIQVNFIDGIRKEKKFASVLELQEQLIIDKESVLSLLS